MFVNCKMPTFDLKSVIIRSINSKMCQFRINRKIHT